QSGFLPLPPPGSGPNLDGLFVISEKQQLASEIGGEGGKFLISKEFRGFPEFVLPLELSKIDD
ncbi:MAG: hypothetical protein OEW64_10185, partial [Gammaproteobacteria bacterium]|nr:hypothetical protein [Gammaproteobacteria bacterium]